MSPLKLPYRADIDGMRGLAILAVILFHAFPEICPGGFTGVDIFFVLSGYLITGIILADLSRGAFSFADFYARRIRRIFPALLVVLISCLVAGWFLLFPHEWRALARNVLAGAGFYSNLQAAGERGYFDAAASTQPLLHLWSLGIEEQFYIFWPVTLVLLQKRPRWVPAGTLFLAGASFALNLALVGRDPAQAFYNPATRMWELLAGAALAWFTLNYGKVQRRSRGELLSVAGLVLIAAGFFMIDSSKPFPGWWALAPVTGTAMLVRAGAAGWFNRKVLASPPAVFVGLISYPLYLWHWPLLVFAGLLDQSDYHLSPQRMAVLRTALVMVAFLLAWGTYQLWEIPMRFSARLTSPYRVRLLLASMAVVAVLGMISVQAIPARLNSPAAAELEILSDDRGHCENFLMLPFTAREIRSRGSSATLLVGDSNMAQYESRIETAIQADPHRATAVFVTSGGCPPLPGLNPAAPGYRCPAFYDYWTSMAMQPRFSTVAIAAAWLAYPPISLRTSSIPSQARQPSAQDLDAAWAGLKATIQSLVKAGKRVVLIASIPVADSFDPGNAISRVHTPAVWRIPPVPRAAIERIEAETNQKLSALAHDSGAEIVWPMDYLCPGGQCQGLEGGSPIYVNYYHLRASKAAKLATFVDDLVRPSDPVDSGRTLKIHGEKPFAN